MSLIKWFDLSTLERPEYQERHIFVAKLRLLIFAGFWAVYIYFTRGVLFQTWPVLLVVLLSFLLTAFAYFEIAKGKLFISALWLQLFADIIAITAIVYLTGGPYSPYYMIYIIYCLAAGLFYHYKLALIAGVFCAVYYGIFLILCQTGIIPPLAIHYRTFPVTTSPFVRWLLLLIFMGIAGYALKISGYFQKRREKALEDRNRELSALHRMSSQIRRAISLSSVVEQILSGTLDGLDLEMATLLLFDHDERKIKLFTPKHHQKKPKLDKMLSKHSKGIELPWEALEQPALKDVLNERIIFRRSLQEVLFDSTAMSKISHTHNFEKMFGSGKVVAIPLISSGRVLGALIGLTHEHFFDDRLVQRLEAFANQASLFLEAAALIYKLKQTNEKLEEASRVKSEFLAMMGHELRTPLTAIIGFSEVLLEGVMGNITDEQKDCIDEVVRNGRDLLGIINSLLDLSKAEAGKAKLEIEPVHIESFIKEIKGAIRPLSSKKKIRIHVDVTEDMPSINLDRKKMKQVLVNLIANAIKFTPQNGTITIDSKYFPTPKDLPKNYSEKYWNDKYKSSFSIHVEDTGAGIHEDHLEKIFETFHQVDSSMTRSFGGTGLGLSLARQYVELHSGVIWAENNKGKGARFTIIMPAITA